METITIDGREYPFRATMGAMVRFRRMSGREVSELNSSDLSDVVLFMYCCTLSACKADGVEFNMEFLEFADRLTPDDMNAFNAQFEAGKKK